MTEKEYLETKILLEEEYGTTNPSTKEIVKVVLKEMMMMSIYIGAFLCYFIWSVFKDLFVANYKGFVQDLSMIAFLVGVFIFTVCIKVKFKKNFIKEFNSFKI